MSVQHTKTSNLLLRHLSRFAHLSTAKALCAVALMLACVLLVPGIAMAEGEDLPELKEAKTAALLDENGNILYDLNARERQHPASITKVMTAMVVLDSGHDLNETVTITAPDLGENSQMGDYATGDKITLDELLQVMLVYSANDAAWNAACFVAGDEASFVELMNQKAAQIGMEGTHFANSHGLEDDNHYSCAYDLALMGRYALEHYPYIARTVVRDSVEAHVYGGVSVFKSTDRLLETFNGIRGIKTGAIIDNYTFLGASGRGDIQLYTAVLGCATFMGRFDDAASLMEWGYSHYQTAETTKAGWVIRADPLASDFGYKAIIHTPANFTGHTWQSLGGYSYKTVLPRPSRLLDTNTLYGWTQWKQAGTNMGTAYYQTREVPARTSSWPIFSLPLFQDTATLGSPDANV